MTPKIEAVTFCVNYARELNTVAPNNLPFFEKWVIATEARDEETRYVCRQHGLQCLISEDHHWNGDGLNKGRMVDRALQHMSAGLWRLHIDADICLPAKFRRVIDQAHLYECNIYGADRVMVRSQEQWQKLLASGWLHGRTQGPNSVEVPNGFGIGPRWSSHESGYVPIGFFQLWHGSQDEWHGVRTKPYPHSHGSACRSDVQHALQWDRRNRVMIPELYVVHLESEATQNGANWDGRTTKPFGPSPRISKGRCS